MTVKYQRGQLCPGFWFKVSDREVYFSPDSNTEIRGTLISHSASHHTIDVQGCFVHCQSVLIAVQLVELLVLNCVCLDALPQASKVESPTLDVPPEDIDDIDYRWQLELD